MGAALRTWRLGMRTWQGYPTRGNRAVFLIDCCLLDLINTVTENQWLCILLD